MAQPHKHSIFVTGAVDTHLFSTSALETGEKLGRTLAQKNIALLVSEEAGFPLWVAKGAVSEMGTLLLFSPAAHKDEHERVYRLPQINQATSTIYTGFGRVGAELIGIRSADAVIVGCGQFAYMHAFTTALYEQKPIGVLEGDWENHEALDHVLKNSPYKHDGIFFDTDPHALVERIEAFLRKAQK